MLDVIVRPLSIMAPTSDTPSSVRISRGGAAANLAVALGEHHDVRYVGAVGDDESGAMFARELDDAGVTPQLQVFAGSTGVVVALVSDEGQRAMMTDRGVNSLLSLEGVLGVLGDEFDHLHVSGYTVLDDATRHVASAALEVARLRGSSTSVDVCSVGPLARLGSEEFLAAIGRVTMLFANEEESLLLAGVGDVDRASERLCDVAQEVVITLGPRGAMVRRGGERWTSTSKDVVVVDTTGAGDAAAGAYLAGRLDGIACVEALALAMTSAATVVGGLGARG